ncbi:AAA family ATPase [Deinococcus aetherius]|uniref:AAA family ATPase n=1 Tax=Deinococcus aetherius TaxID=200252 RepID=UPI00222E9F57|nr:AAA family ATPase [Deinococcus aetherius]
MKRILITGMSGTGKTSVIEELSRRGFTAIDTDSDEWCEWTVGHEVGSETSEPDWVWREDRMWHLLSEPREAPLFVSGCKTNQGKFYDRFDHVVLLSALPEVMLERIKGRTNNPYGKSAEERDRILQHVRFVEPLLRHRATLELDTSALTVAEVADRLLALTTRNAQG